MRERISTATKAAMKSGDKPRVSTLRLMTAAIQERDIAAQLGGNARDRIDEAEIQALMQRMIKQRRESMAIYSQNGRDELAAKEEAEIAIIEEFLPKQMSDAEIAVAVEGIATELGAAGVKDMGRVMAAMKERYSGRMDFGRASARLKERLG